ASRMIARASRSDSTAMRCSYQPIASASSVSDAHRRANVRVSPGSSAGGSWYWSKPIRACSHLCEDLGRVSATDDLDQLSSPELHDRAVARARRHLDLKFFWDLIERVPAAEAAAGEFDKADADLEGLLAHIDDVTDAGRGEVAELLRGFYLDYLRRHAS